MFKNKRKKKTCELAYCGIENFIVETVSYDDYSV